MKTRLFTLTLLSSCIAAAAGMPAAHAASFSVIAEGFDNASGLTYGPDGNLYLGELGRGGDGACQPSPSVAFAQICQGNTGAIAKINPETGETSNVVSGFDSLALQPSGYEGAGPQEVAFDGQNNAYFVTGWAGNPANRDTELNALSANVSFPPQQNQIAPALPADEVINAPELGRLYSIDLSTGNYTAIADLSKAELLTNPDKGDVISNPYAVAIKGDTAYVADGGANVVWKTKLDGSNVTPIVIPARTVENPEFPPPEPGSAVPSAGTGSDGEALPPAGQQGLPSGEGDSPGVPGQPGEGTNEATLQSVPTGITVGPDGDIYVSEYSGFPFPEGKARIWRIGEDGQPQVYADGFTQITDLKFDKDGNLLVLQFADQSQWKGTDTAALPGSLIKLAADGTKTTLIAAGEGLESATGLEVAPDGTIYAVNKGIGPDNGQVIRIDELEKAAGGEAEEVPEPTSMLGVLLLGALGGGAVLKRKRNQLAEQVKFANGLDD